MSGSKRETVCGRGGCKVVDHARLRQPPSQPRISHGGFGLLRLLTSTLLWTGHSSQAAGKGLASPGSNAFATLKPGVECQGHHCKASWSPGATCCVQHTCWVGVSVCTRAYVQVYNTVVLHVCACMCDCACAQSLEVHPDESHEETREQVWPPQTGSSAWHACHTIAILLC